MTPKLALYVAALICFVVGLDVAAVLGGSFPLRASIAIGGVFLALVLAGLVRRREAPDEGRAMSSAKTRSIVAALVAAVVVAVALGVAVGIQGIRSGEGPASSLRIANEPAEVRADGSMAPDFSLPALDGEGDITLSEFRGDVVVLNFWASWCGPCRREAPALQAAWEDYRDLGVQFIGVNHQDARASAQAYERELGITYPSVFDPAGELALDFGLLGVPTTLDIDGEGRIAYRFTGYLDDRALRESIEDALARESG